MQRLGYDFRADDIELNNPVHRAASGIAREVYAYRLDGPTPGKKSRLFSFDTMGKIARAKTLAFSEVAGVGIEVIDNEGA